MISKSSFILTALFIFTSALLVGVLFQPALTSYYFQDDWFAFSISKSNNIWDFISFFQPRNDVIWFRPLGVQLPFYLASAFFGLNPVPFKIAVIILHFLNSFLIYKVLLYFLKKPYLSAFGAFLYLTSSSHQLLFYWAAVFSFVLAAFFYFGAFLAVLKGKAKIGLILYVLGLLTNELLITLPLVLAMVSCFFKKSVKIRNFFYFILISLFYIGFRFLFKPTASGYFFINSINQPLVTLRNFFLWSLNWPEAIQDWFLGFLHLDPLFIRTFTPFATVFSAVTLVFLILFLVLPLISVFSAKKWKFLKVAVFGLLFFLVVLTPVLIFRSHAFSYYLVVPFFGFLLCFLSLFSVFVEYNRLNRKILLVIIIVFSLLWISSSYLNIRLNKRIHWAYKRSKRSNELIHQILKSYSKIPEDFSVKLSSNNIYEDKLILSDQNAVRVIFGNSNLKTIYNTD